MNWSSSESRRKTVLTICAVTICLILVTTGCGKQNPTPKASSTGTGQTMGKTVELLSIPEMASFFGLINGMALNLHKHVFAEDPGNNVFLSPISVEMALAMTENGAADETLSAMKNTLGLSSLSNEQVNQSNKAFLDSLDKLDPTIELEMANALWLKNDLNFSDEFLRDNTEYYDAALRRVDFTDPGTGEEINQWASEKTRGRITGFPPPPPDSRFTLADAIYFKGTWLYPFDQSKTTDADFKLIDGDTKQVPMMSQLCTNCYYENDQFQMVALRYGKSGSYDNEVTMYVFLPRDVDGISAFVESLTPENWKSWMSDRFITPVDLKLPRFRIEYARILNNALSAMGMGIAFSDKADFSKMISGAGEDEGLFLQTVLQKSFVEVNEEGTEAAAVTIIAEGEEGPRKEPEVHTMVVDHPFFFAICDDASEAILFTGTVLAP